MRFLRAIKEKNRLNCIAVIFLVAFLLWGYSFRGFITNKLRLHSDATSYYEHFKFYTDNISRGIYPMWEPIRQKGIPAEFFMRRIGSYNPFIFLILILNTIGISYPSAYILFLTIYFFIGIIGFYLLAKQLFHDSKMAFVASMLLMFSSLGTRLFDSYFNLVMIPMIWFFYFLLAFTEKQEKRHFLGLTFTLMILCTTYIPLYFLTIFLCFLLCFSVFYFRILMAFLINCRNFIRKNKIFVCLCAAVLILSLLPGLLLFQSMSEGEIVLPNRNYNYAHTPVPSETLEVDIQNVVKWGIAEDLIYSYSITDLRKFKFAIFYLPIFSYILFFLGIFTDMNKKLLFLFTFALLMFLVGTPFAVPLYKFLHAHVHFFKYFRNLHFFLWLIILPLLILFVTGQFQMFLNYTPRTRRDRYALLAFLLTIHAGFAVFLLIRGDGIFPSYLVILLSFAFFVFHFYSRLKIKTAGLLFIFLLLITIQPLGAYHYFSKNSQKVPEGVMYPYRYAGSTPFLKLELPNSLKTYQIAADKLEEGENTSSINENKTPSMYMATLWYSLLDTHIRRDILGHYAGKKLLVYDHVEHINDENLDFERIGQAFRRNQNVAFISTGKSDMYVPETHGRSASHAQVITKNSKQVNILDFDVNHFKLRTNFNSRKFLVYNDNFHSGWTAFIDGEKTDLYRANVAFKGLWIPKGEHVVYFRFGTIWRRVLDYSLIVVFTAVFVWLVCISGVCSPKRS